MDKVALDEIIRRMYKINPLADRIEILSEFKGLKENITFRCKTHGYEATIAARCLTKSVCCPECNKELPKQPPRTVHIGDRFGSLTVIDNAEPYISKKGIKRKQVVCLCDCGNKTIIRNEALTKKNGTVSCGCLQKKLLSNLSKKYNEYDLTGEYGIGYTDNGYEFYFDLEDYDKIKDYCWNFDGLYVITHDTPTTTKRLHKLLMEDYTTEEQPLIDHKNGNTRDNRKSINLRICNSTQNACNTAAENNTGWHGVTFHNGKYITSIKLNREVLEMHSFDNLKDAVEKRIELEEKYHGDFSYYKSRGIIYSE